MLTWQELEQFYFLVIDFSFLHFFFFFWTITDQVICFISITPSPNTITGVLEMVTANCIYKRTGNHLDRIWPFQPIYTRFIRIMVSLHQEHGRACMLGREDAQEQMIWVSERICQCNYLQTKKPSCCFF